MILTYIYNIKNNNKRKSGEREKDLFPHRGLEPRSTR